MTLKIMLDPGHGFGKNYNRGFLDIDGYKNCNEGDMNFIFCKNYFKPALEKAGFFVSMTRENPNDNPSLYERGKMAKGYEFLISSHTNAGGGLGAEIYDSTNSNESIKALTDKILRSHCDKFGFKNRGTKYRKNKSGSNYYGILRYGMAKHNFIVEWCFHDNYEDVKKYLDNMKEIAATAAKVMSSYFNGKENGRMGYEKNWADEAINFVKNEGIMTGDENGFRPDDFVTRAELATVVKRVMERFDTKK